MTYRFRDRAEAGQRLAQLLAAYADHPDVIVLALPRGGVPVAFAVAQALHAPLDILVVRKLGLPGQEELAMGAITTGGVRVLNDEIVDALRIPNTIIERVTAREHAELERRERAYRGGRPAPVLRDQTVMLVDDGLATGTTMRAAIAVVRAQRPAQIIVAVPVAAADSLAALRPLVDALVWVLAPEPFDALGRWYADFAPTTDAEVCELLARGARAPSSTGDRQQVSASEIENQRRTCA